MQPAREVFDVIIVAAGSSQRFRASSSGQEIQKQFLLLKGLPLFLWSVRAFARERDCARIVIATSRELMGEVQKVTFADSVVSASGKIFEVVEGGATRQASVLKALTALRKLAAGWRGPETLEAGTSSEPWPAGSQYVMIHDAARPLVSKALIERVWKMRGLADGIIPGIEPADTVKMLGADHEVSQTLDRSRLRLIQTPQLFKTSVITDLHQRALNESGGEGGALDDSVLAEQVGLRVVVVEGDWENRKVTYQEDFELVSHWARDRHP